MDQEMNSSEVIDTGKWCCVEQLNTSDLETDWKHSN